MEKRSVETTVVKEGVEMGSEYKGQHHAKKAP
jgi:hypothetical protein